MGTEKEYGRGEGGGERGSERVKDDGGTTKGCEGKEREDGLE